MSPAQFSKRLAKQYSFGMVVVPPVSSIRLITLPLAEAVPSISNWMRCVSVENPDGLLPLNRILSPFFAKVTGVPGTISVHVSPPSVEYFKSVLIAGRFLLSNNLSAPLMDSTVVSSETCG